MSPETGPGVGRDRALGRAAHDVGLVPAVVRVGLADGDGGALPDGGRGHAVGQTGGLVAELLDDLGHATGPRRGGDQQVALLQDLGLQLLPAHGVDQPLHPGPQLVVAVAVVGEDPEDRLEGGHEVLAGGELLEGEGGVRVGAEAAGDEDPEAGLDAAVVAGAGGGDHADVVEHGLAAVGVAAGEVDLELAGQALGQRVVQEVLERGLGPGGDVEHLVGAGAGEVAALDVADGVAAGLPRGQADGGEVPQDGGYPLQLDEVELDVLTGGDVAPAPGVLVGDVTEHVELVGGDRAVGQLDPDHLVVPALPLAVDAVVQAEHPEDVLRRGHPPGSARVGPRTSRRRRRWPGRS